MVEPVPMPSGLVLFGIAFVLASLLVFTLWAVNVLLGKVRGCWNMSSGGTQDSASAAGATGLAKSASEGLQPIATPCKPTNDDLALGALGNNFANDLGDITPAEARAIIR